LGEVAPEVSNAGFPRKRVTGGVAVTVRVYPGEVKLPAWTVSEEVPAATPVATPEEEFIVATPLVPLAQEFAKVPCESVVVQLVAGPVV
jgi:hypothetical protein